MAPFFCLGFVQTALGFGLLPAALFLNSLSGLRLLELFLSAALFLLSSLSGFLLELFLSAALFLSSLSGFGLSAYLRRHPWLLQCFTDVLAKLFDP